MRIITPKYKSDDNLLISLQEKSYRQNINLMFFKAKIKYVNAIKLVGVETDLYLKLKEVNRFNHLIFKNAYNLIASFFRINNPKSRYLNLNFDYNNDVITNHKKMLSNKWDKFWDKQMNIFLENNQIVISILESVVYCNSEIGNNSMKRLIRLLSYRYG